MPNSDDAIQSYVSICNEALHLNKDRFPFKQILGAARNNEVGKKIEVQIKGAGAQNSYFFSIENNCITAQNHDSCDNCQCDRKWSVEWPYLIDVLSHPESYIKNPAKIDWNWMYDSIG